MCAAAKRQGIGAPERLQIAMTGMTVCDRTCVGKVEVQLSVNSLRVGLGERVSDWPAVKERDWFTSGITWDLLDSNNVRERESL